MEHVKFPWADENGEDADKPSDEEILAAGGDPTSDLWWLETGDLRAAEKNAGKDFQALGADMHNFALK